jgi:putative component of toxin-antitoxin plasmid stabilization module
MTAGPFDDWLDALKDRVGRSAIDMRINKLRRGLIGDFNDVGDGGDRTEI